VTVLWTWIILHSLIYTQKEDKSLSLVSWKRESLNELTVLLSLSLVILMVKHITITISDADWKSVVDTCRKELPVYDEDNIENMIKKQLVAWLLETWVQELGV
jgi:hypothetical protein